MFLSLSFFSPSFYTTEVWGEFRAEMSQEWAALVRRNQPADSCLETLFPSRSEAGGTAAPTGLTPPGGQTCLASRPAASSFPTSTSVTQAFLKPYSASPFDGYLVPCYKPSRRPGETSCMWADLLRIPQKKPPTDAFTLQDFRGEPHTP